MKSTIYGLFFRFCRGFIRFFSPKYTVILYENSNQPVVYVSHHQNLFGPFMILLWFPQCLRTWVLHVFLNQKLCFKQYVEYTFTKRFGFNQYFAKIFAFPISVFISKLLNSGKSIPVYRGSRKIMETFQLSIQALKNGESVAIFPDIDYTNNSSSTKEMYDGYLYIEKYYYKKIKQHVTFVPLYVSKKRRLIISGHPITFNGDENFAHEQKKVALQIQENLNQLAKKCGDV